MKRIILIFAILLTSCQPLSRLLAAPLPVLTITRPGTYDGSGEQRQGIVIRNVSDVTLINYNVVGKIQITDSARVTLQKITVTKAGATSGAISINATSPGTTHDITVEDFAIIGGNATGWGFSGSGEQVMSNIIIRRGTIEDVGQEAGVQTHGMYIENCDNCLIEDVTILRSYNAGIKIVRDVTNITFRRVTILGSGRSGLGGGMMFGEPSVASKMDNIVIEDCRIENSVQPAIYILSKVTNLTMDNCYLKNNYYALMVASGSTGWKITNTTGWNESNYPSAHEPLYLAGSVEATGNTFTNNNWYYGGQAPVRLGSTSLSLAQWQARGQDVGSVSERPSDAPTTPTATASLTHTRTPVPPTATFTATRTPTATHTATATFTPTYTPTAMPTITPLCIKSVWTLQLKARPDDSMYNITTGMSIDPGAIIFVESIDADINGEGIWARINYKTYAAMWLASNNRTYAVEIPCP